MVIMESINYRHVTNLEITLITHWNDVFCDMKMSLKSDKLSSSTKKKFFCSWTNTSSKSEKLVNNMIGYVSLVKLATCIIQYPIYK